MSGGMAGLSSETSSGLSLSSFKLSKEPGRTSWLKNDLKSSSSSEASYGSVTQPSVDTAGPKAQLPALAGQLGACEVAVSDYSGFNYVPGTALNYDQHSSTYEIQSNTGEVTSSG